MQLCARCPGNRVCTEKNSTIRFNFQNDEDVFAIAWHMGTEYCEADRLLRHAMGDEVGPLPSLVQTQSVVFEKGEAKKHTHKKSGNVDKGSAVKDEL